MASPTFPFRSPTLSSSSSSTSDSSGPSIQPSDINDVAPPDLDKYGKPILASPETPPTKGTAKGGGPIPNPDTEWWKGASKSLLSNESGVKLGLFGPVPTPWVKGAVTDIPSSIRGALSSIGQDISNPKQTAHLLKEGLSHPIDTAGILGNQIKDATMQSGTPEGQANFQELMGQLGGQPLIADLAGPLATASAPVATKVASATLPVVGRGLQNIGDFIKKYQPITGLAPPMIVPRTARLLEKGLGTGINYGGRGLETVGNKISASNQLDLGLGPDDINKLMKGLANPNDITLTDEVGPTTNNASGESSASAEAISRVNAMKAKGQQFAYYDSTGKMTPLPGVDGVDYTPSKGQTYGIQGPSGFQVLDDNGGKVPFSQINKAQAKVNAIQNNVNNKYGSGNTEQATKSTQTTLNDTKQNIPVLNRPGTNITLREPTPDMIKQAQQLGYKVVGKNPDGSLRMVQTGYLAVMR